MKKLFTEHPASVGESYFEHLFAASCFSAGLLIAAMACLVHAVLPFMFVKTGSHRVTVLYQRMVAQRNTRVVEVESRAIQG